jgi:hypothetical protein
MVLALACRNIEAAATDRGQRRDTIDTRRVLDTLDWLLGGFDFTAKPSRQSNTESNPSSERQTRQSADAGSLSI